MSIECVRFEPIQVYASQTWVLVTIETSLGISYRTFSSRARLYSSYFSRVSISKFSISEPAKFEHNFHRNMHKSSFGGLGFIIIKKAVNDVIDLLHIKILLNIFMNYDL